MGDASILEIVLDPKDERRWRFFDRESRKPILGRLTAEDTRTEEDLLLGTANIISESAIPVEINPRVYSEALLASGLTVEEVNALTIRFVDTTEEVLDHSLAGPKGKLAYGYYRPSRGVTVRAGFWAKDDRGQEWVFPLSNNNDVWETILHECYHYYQDRHGDGFAQQGGTTGMTWEEYRMNFYEKQANSYTRSINSALNIVFINVGSTANFEIKPRDGMVERLENKTKMFNWDKGIKVGN